MRIVQVNFAFDQAISEPDALLDRYQTLTAWGGALAARGAHVRTVQRFTVQAVRSRAAVEYVFCPDDRRLATVAAEFRPDIVHVNGVIFPVRTWMLRRRLPATTAVVVQAHSDPALMGRAPLMRAAGWLLRDAVDGFLVSAPEHGDALRAAGFAAADRPSMHQVMEGSTGFRPLPRDAARAESGISGSPAVLWVGRLNPNKDPLTALDGFERALPSLPGATLTMAYSTPELLMEVQARIASSDALRLRVRLIGEVPHERLAAFFSAADIFVVGSHHEGSGYSLMEACACGAVPVVTGIPTFRLLTGNGSIGALWQVGDAADAARAIVSVARRDLDTERARLADHFARDLSWEAV